MNILTIDLEEWFHAVFETNPAGWADKESRILKNAGFILDVLRENEQKATFFTVGWLARQYPALIKTISRAGFELASHSDYHRVAYKFSRQEFKSDVGRSVESLAALTGQKVRMFRAPYFSITEAVDSYLETLAENGIEFDSSICPAKTKYGGYKGFPTAAPCLIQSNNCTVKEFPLSIYKFFNKGFIYSGGGYFRLYPFLLVKSLFTRQPYNMTYFHPHDFDGAPPPMDISFIADLRRTIGASSAAEKFRRLLTTFDFLDLDAADKCIDWQRVPVINISKHD